jgi:hypothetical protein
MGTFAPRATTRAAAPEVQRMEDKSMLNKDVILRKIRGSL